MREYSNNNSDSQISIFENNIFLSQTDIKQYYPQRTLEHL